MLRSMDLAGLDGELADQVGLFSVLDMQFSWEGRLTWRMIAKRVSVLA